MGKCRIAEAEHDDKSSEENDTNTYTKTCIITKEVPVWEFLDKFKEEFSKAASHCHFKRIQEREFQSALTFLCLTSVNYREAMGALWTRGCINLLMCAVYHKSVTKTDFFQ